MTWSRAGTQGGVEGIRGSVGGHDEDRAREAAAASLPHQQQALGAGQRHVDQHRVDGVILVGHRRMRLASVLRADHLAARRGEHLAERPPHEVLLIDDEDAREKFRRLRGKNLPGGIRITRAFGKIGLKERVNMNRFRQGARHWSDLSEAPLQFSAPHDPHPTREGPSLRTWMVLSTCAAFTVFAVDFLAAPTVFVSILYAVLVLLNLRAPDPRAALAIAILCSILAWTDAILTHRGSEDRHGW